ncbi:trehalose-phosphatase [Natrononativus amylolyticus]|uniref:trehalose-phosphatase n=1 Tax=Natrononativus amylolyticus TaxID=2963434 RepID=UPI0020CECA62|nr:trehalose-phosphatase [Natrononativus amylolyticus]
MSEKVVSDEAVTPPPPLSSRLPWLRTELRNASRLLVCLDFDGTLAPIVDDPDAAAPTEANQRALDSLAEVPPVSTAVVSGRSLTDVRSRVQGPDVYAGNHGLELERDGTVSVHPVARKRAESIDEVCAALETVLEPIPNCRVENKRLTATVHVRSVPPVGRDIVFQRVTEIVARFGDDALSLSTGKAVIEVSPAVPWGKGDAVELIEADCPPETFVLYLGDDTTDESAFRAVQSGGLGVHVGAGRDTAAAAGLESPAAVAPFLDWLAETGVRLVAGQARPSRERAVALAPGQ